MFPRDGVMPADGPENVEKVLKAFDPDANTPTWT